MKILYLLDSLNRGGAETLVLDVCRNAAANDLDIVFAAMSSGGALESEFKSSNVGFIRLKRRLPIDFLVIKQLKNLIKERQINIIHTHQAVEAAHAYFACLGTNVKIVLTHHGFVPDSKNLFALKFLIPRMATNIIVSRALLKWYENKIKLNFPARNTKILYNGVDEKRLEPSSHNLRKELNLPEDVFLMGMIANFYRDPRKDQMTVCRAMPRVFSEVKNAHCIFVGKTEPGAEEKFDACVDFCRKNDIADRVHFLGGRNDVPDVLAALNLFVFSSLQEGLPIAVTEAMLAGVPLIVSDIEPLLEATDNGKYAEVFQTQNVSELSEKILNLAKNTDLRRDMGNQACKFTKENFSIEAHLRALKKLYNSLLT